jgi:hypothetical protein
MVSAYTYKEEEEEKEELRKEKSLRAPDQVEVPFYMVGYNRPIPEGSLSDSVAELLGRQVIK